MNKKEVYLEDGSLATVEIIGQFRIDEVNRDYVMYTLNDDGKSEDVIVLIAQIEMIDGKMKFVSIPDKERNMVVSFFNYVKNSICKE